MVTRDTIMDCHSTGFPHGKPLLTATQYNQGQKILLSQTNNFSAMAARVSGNNPIDLDISSLEPEERTVSTKKEICMVLAGKPAAGKSTLAGNIFGLDKEMKLSPDPVTTEYSTTTTEKNGVTLHVTDTRGLQQRGKKEELKKLAKHTKKEKAKVDLLVYCMTVDPSCKFADGNPNIMRSLQEAFGKEIWKHCVLIFTFSNRVWDWYEKNQGGAREHERINMYEDFMRQYADRFRTELQKLRVQHVNVETVLTLNMDPPRAGHTTIPAIPAGDLARDRVMPRFEPTRILIRNRDHPGNRREVDIKDWRDVIFVEIIKKCSSELQRSLLQYRYHYDFIDTITSVAGV